MFQRGKKSAQAFVNGSGTVLQGGPVLGHDQKGRAVQEVSQGVSVFKPHFQATEQPLSDIPSGKEPCPKFENWSWPDLVRQPWSP